MQILQMGKANYAGPLHKVSVTERALYFSREVQSEDFLLGALYISAAI
jgi:hypothetical protein